jgi:glutamyl-tRNA reductase
VRAVPLGQLAEAVGPADLVLVAVAGDGHVVAPGHLRRDGGSPPVVVVDLGVPRNVDPAVRHHPAVTLLDMDDLRSSVEAAMEGRQDQLVAARAIVGEEVARYRAASRARLAAPVVAALRTRLESLRQAELDRARRPGMTDAEFAAADEVSRAALAKVLHEPTVALKEAAGTPRGERLVEALRVLFDL